MLKLIVASPCPFCSMVTDFITEHPITGIEIEDTKWSFERHDELREQYGKSQVPLLILEDGEPLYESGDIIEYLKSRQS